MYEDTPQELVHDLFSEAVFGAHALGRPVIGTADVISTVSRRAIAAYHRSMYTGGNIVVAAAGNIAHDRSSRCSQRFERAARRRPRGGAARAPAARADAAAGPALPAQGHRAVPRLPRRARHLALRPAPLRRLAARLDPRRLGVVAPLPGDPREARHGVRGLQLRVAVHRHRADRLLRRHARGEPRRVRRDLRRADRRDRGRASSARASSTRAKESLKGRIMLSMESTSNRMSRLGKSLIADTELLTFERIIAEIDAVDEEALAELAAVLLAPERLSASGVGPDEDAVPRRRASARTRRSSRAQRHEGRALRRGGEGRACARAGARARGPRGARHRDRRRDRRRGLDAAVDFTTPEAAPANVRAALEQDVSCVVGTTGWDPAPLGALARGARAEAVRRAELLDRRGADDALRAARRRRTSRARRSSSCTTRRRRTRRREPRRRRPI